MLTVKDVAQHWQLRPETIRRWISSGKLKASRLNRAYRLDWKDVWACERGLMPSGKAAVIYKKTLLTKDELAAEYRVSVRTVERWVADGLPTRNVFGSVRFNEDDVAEWLAREIGFGCSARGGGSLRYEPEQKILRNRNSGLLDWP